MVDVSPFGADDAGDRFDDYDEFVPANVPEPGPFLVEGDVLTGRDHLAFHRLTRRLFEERTVYDITFDYNLARLNLDVGHPDAGYRYARDPETPDTLRAEFTPTTAFCPQTRTLTVASFRAWNAERDRHEYDLVEVRAAPMHQRSEAINQDLADMAATFRETSEIEAPDEGDDDAARALGGGAGGPTAPF